MAENSTETSHIPETTIETIARSFYKESYGYGFKQVDYLKFVNNLLDIAMKHRNGGSEQPQVNTPVVDMVSSDEEMRFPLCGSRLFIRRAAPLDDKPLFKKWLDDEYGRHFLLSRVTARYMGLDEFLYDEKNIIGIITLLNGDSIGAMAFLDYDAHQHKAELRKMIGEPAYRGKGYAKEASRLWLHFGQNSLHLNKIYLNTLDTNIRNIKLNEELGFKVEGILRGEVVVDGQYKDVLRMGLRFDY